MVTTLRSRLLKREWETKLWAFLSEAEPEGLQNPEKYIIYFEIDADGDVH